MYLIGFFREASFNLARQHYDFVSNYMHEIAHFWWNNVDATTRNNWLDESCAEYSSLLAQKHIYGDSIYNKSILKHERRAESIPDTILPANYERYGKYQHAISYSYGSLIMKELHDDLGDSEFYDLMVAMDSLSVGTTENFATFLTSRYGETEMSGVMSKLGYER